MLILSLVQISAIELHNFFNVFVLVNELLNGIPLVAVVEVVQDGINELGLFCSHVDFL